MDDPVECCEAPYYVRCDSGRSRCTKGANETSQQICMKPEDVMSMV